MITVYASFKRRALARLIDLAVVLVPCGGFYLVDRLLGFPLRYNSLFNFVWPESPAMFMSTDFPGVFLTFVAIKLFIAYPYFAMMESSRWQGTLGKLTMQIKVTDIDGRGISFGRATGRYFLKGVSATLLMTGYLVSFSDRRQTWHDYMGKTIVIGKNIFPLYYVLPGISSSWMFDLPGRPAAAASRLTQEYECISCDYRSDEKRVGCPSCGRQFGYVEVGVLRALLLMNGIIFTVIGGFLSYFAIQTISERLLDDQLGRTGAPWGVIFIICVAASACMAVGLSALFGKRWPLRVLLRVAVGLARR
jgi:uncharacterized RDD family membrane protein YckC